jgi:acetyltransferase
VAERYSAEIGRNEILGVGRLSKIHGTHEAEFALTVSDQWHGHGLGTQFLKLLIQAGHDEKLERLSATMLGDNHAMQHIARKAGFALQHSPNGNEYRAELAL